MKPFLVLVFLAFMIAIMLWADMSTTRIYRRVSDRKVVRVLDALGREVKFNPAQADKLIGEVVWVAPDYKK